MRSENRSRSAVVAEAIETYYTMRQWKELQAAGAGRARKLKIRDESDVERLVHEYRGRRK
jgi:metal-responsive CopG/Arc/MetJ family transcriptional regulator